MTTYQAIADFRTDYLDSFNNTFKASIDGVYTSVDLAMTITREHMLYPFDWALAMARKESPRQPTDLLDDHLRASSHILAEHYTRMVQLLESHMHIINRNAHRSLNQMQYWSPRDIESTLQTLDQMVDVAESSSDKLADATVDFVHTMDQQLDTSA